jgi:hypothetical protein
MAQLMLFGVLVVAASVAFVVGTVRRDREAEAVPNAAYEAWLAARGQEHEVPVRVVVLSAVDFAATLAPRTLPALPEVGER